MKRPWQFSLSSLLLAMVVLSVVAGLLARFGAVVYIVLMGCAIFTAFVGIARGETRLALGSAICFLLLLAASSTVLEVAVWDGRRTVSLRFIVVDAATEGPISGANVRLRESDLPSPPISIPPGEKGLGSTTASDGSAVLQWDFNASGREGMLEHSGHVFFNNQGLWLQVSAPGYESQLACL